MQQLQSSLSAPAISPRGEQSGGSGENYSTPHPKQGSAKTRHRCASPRVSSQPLSSLSQNPSTGERHSPSSYPLAPSSRLNYSLQTDAWRDKTGFPAVLSTPLPDCKMRLLRSGHRKQLLAQLCLPQWAAALQNLAWLLKSPSLKSQRLELLQAKAVLHPEDNLPNFWVQHLGTAAFTSPTARPPPPPLAVRADHPASEPRAPSSQHRGSHAESTDAKA